MIIICTCASLPSPTWKLNLASSTPAKKISLSFSELTPSSISKLLPDKPNSIKCKWKNNMSSNSQGRKATSMPISLSAKRMTILKDVSRTFNPTKIRASKLLEKLNSFLKNPAHNASSSSNYQLMKQLKLSSIYSLSTQSLS